KRALAVLTVGAAMCLSWIPGRAAQTADPPGPVVAQSQPAAPPAPGPEPFPLADNGPKLRPIASSAPRGAESGGGRATEKPAAFRRVEAPPAEAAWQTTPPVSPSRPVAD